VFSLSETSSRTKLTTGYIQTYWFNYWFNHQYCCWYFNFKYVRKTMHYDGVVSIDRQQYDISPLHQLRISKQRLACPTKSLCVCTFAQSAASLSCLVINITMVSKWIDSIGILYQRKKDNYSKSRARRRLQGSTTIHIDLHALKEMLYSKAQSSQMASIIYSAEVDGARCVGVRVPTNNHHSNIVTYFIELHTQWSCGLFHYEFVINISV